MTKFLAVKPQKEEVLPLEAFNYVVSNFHFTTNESECLVSPFVVITDGRDILAYVNEQDEVEVGFSTVVEKPTGVHFRNTPDLFHQAVEDRIREFFFEIFDSAEVVETTESKYLFSEWGKNNKYLSLLCTQKGGYTFNQSKFLPVYFVKINYKDTTHLTLNKFTPQLTQIPVREFVQTGAAAYKLGFMSKAFLIWLSTGEILFPVSDFQL